MTELRRYIRYGIPAEKEILIERANDYHGVAIPAHLAADQSESLPAFLRRLAKPYFVDPMTFAFSTEGADLTNTRGDELKRSYSKLAQRYEWPRQVDFMSEQITAGDFEEATVGMEAALRRFVESVLEFQLSLSIPDDDTRRYEQLALEFGTELFPAGTALQGPEFLVAPYFFFTSYEDPAYALTLLAARHAAEWSRDRAIFAVLAMSSDFFARDDFGKLLDDFRFLRGVIIWVDAFNDQTRGDRELVVLRKLIRELSRRGEVLNLYGGRFSVLLGTSGLSGYSSGICYGESKAQLAISGGVIPPRYYAGLPMMKLAQAETLRFLRAHEVFCTCRVCETVLSEIGGKTAGWQDRFVRKLFPPAGEGRNEADIRLKQHFLESSAEEQTLLAEMSLDQSTEEIRSRSATLQVSDPIFFKTRAAFLLRWERALRATP